MTVLLVRVHWADSPPKSAPVPSVLGLSNVPPTPATPVNWPSVAGGVTPVVGYVPVVTLQKMTAASWDGATAQTGDTLRWPPAPGAASNIWDQGFANGAINFHVTAIRLWVGALGGTTAGSCEARVWAPGTYGASGAAPVATILLDSGTWNPVAAPVPVSITNGAGAWVVEVGRQAGSTRGEPSVYPGKITDGSGAPQAYPFISPYNAELEGILGMELTGTEVYQPQGPSTATSVSYGDCQPDGTRPVTLTITRDEPNAPGSSTVKGRFLLAAGSSTLFKNSSVLQTGSTWQHTVTDTINLAPGDYEVTAILRTGPSGGPWVNMSGGPWSLEDPPGHVNAAGNPAIQVPACDPPPCFDLKVTATSTADPDHPTVCIQPGGSKTVTCTATTTPVSSASSGSTYTGTYTWTLRNPAGQSVAIAPAQTGNQCTVTVDKVGSWELTCSLNQNSPCTDAPDTIEIVVTSCTCPTLQPLTSSGGWCAYTFGYSVDNPTGGDVTLVWTFDGVQQPPTTVTGNGQTTLTGTKQHTFTGGGKKTATLTVSAPGCDPDSESVQVVVDCGDTTPPTVTGCTISGNTVTVTFSEAVVQTEAETPGNYRVTLNQVGTAAVSSASYAAAAATLTVPSMQTSGAVTVDITVTGVHDLAGNPIDPSQATTNCSRPKDEDKVPPTDLCAALLWTALIMIALGAFLAILGCILTSFFPQGGFVLQVIGAILFVLGWILFGLWILLCSAATACAVILAIRTFIAFLIALFLFVGAVLAVIAIFFPAYALCAAYGFAAAANWGLIRIIVDEIARRRRCLIENPGGK